MYPNSLRLVPSDGALAAYRVLTTATGAVAIHEMITRRAYLPDGLTDVHAEQSDHRKAFRRPGGIDASAVCCAFRGNGFIESPFFVNN
jgi:hypothetical protein